MSGAVRRVALTGGIATGKSAALRRFRELGARTIDADVLARTVVEPGTPGLAAIRERFGPDVIGSDDQLDRARLGALVFADDLARRDLERIIHPGVYVAIEDWFEALEADAAASAAPVVAIADIPLLYETDQAHRFDLVIVAACAADVQLARLMARDGLDEVEARQRIAAQIPIDEKRARADLVIDTSAGHEETNRVIDEVWKQLLDRGRRGDP